MLQDLTTKSAEHIMYSTLHPGSDNKIGIRKKMDASIDDESYLLSKGLLYHSIQKHIFKMK